MNAFYNRSQREEIIQSTDQLSLDGAYGYIETMYYYYSAVLGVTVDSFLITDQCYPFPGATSLVFQVKQMTPDI